MTETKNNDERFPEVKPTEPGSDTPYIAPIIGKLGYDTDRPWLFGLGTSPNNGVDFHVFLSFDGLNFDDNDIDKIWNGGTADKVKKEVDSATAEIPAAVSAANSAVQYAESAVAASKVNSDAIVAQSEAISEAKSAMDSATAEIQQTAANAASDAAKIRADVARVQNEVDTAKTANSASVEALKSDIGSAKKDLADVHDSLDKAQSAIEQNQKLINDSVAKITSDVSATKQDLATVHDSLTKAQAAAEQNQKAIDDSIAEINANVDATNQDLAGVRKDLTKAQSDITANQKAIDDNVAQISDDITQDRKDIADVRQGLTKAQSDITANQKAVNDNVAQINSNIEQDRKDIASAQQANADTAKQLDTYSKQATEQGKTIKTIQDKQDGFTATLADVQGNVSQVSDKVDGLSASLKDTQGNVASVKAQADQLSATLTNHGKSIATLTASAKELSSTLEDADGRLSKVEQTAQTNSSTLSDVQGDLSQVKQNATKLVSTLKDAQGNISTLQQKADSLSTQLASAQGDIATLQTGVDSVKATLTSHDKSIHTLQADSKSLKDSMADAQGDISTLSKTATDVTSELEDHTGRLSKVEQSAAKQATTLSDLQGNLSRVEQKADSNTATISSINKNAMQDRGVITDTKTSFDSLTQLGTYSIKASGLPKMPEQHYGTLVVSGSAGSGWLSQQFVADTTGNVYTRVFSNNAWSAWKQGGSQDAINQVKQTADSNSATIRNVQGDVSTLKQTATGIKSTLASHEGDIHTLQADSKSLKDSMTNAQGDISTLQKSATSLDSEMKDHAGRLSKVEQNAATQATTLSNLQGNLTQVKQQADGLVTTLKDAQGSITQIQQKADGMLEQLKSAQGDIASLQTDVTGIKATLTSHEGDIHTLQADSKTLKDDMQDAQGNISSLQKSSTKLDSEMSSQDGRLSKVEQTAKEHTTTISDLGKKVDSNGGGINLLTNTQSFDYNWTWDQIGHSFANDVLTLSDTNNGNSRIYQGLAGYDTTGKTFSLSFNARISADCNNQSVQVKAGPYDAPKLISITSKDFQPYKVENWQWTGQSGTFSFYVAGGKIDITNLKLEYGAVATPYSLAPGDLATISQVKQTADGIETTLKSAQGDIDQIKQTAKGTSEQLSNVQGNVTSIQKDVDGLKQTTADNAGNIHTLQSDSKSLHDSMQDAQGDISTLKKTSTDVVSELKDHAGRISKTEQTASTLVNEFSDQQGHLNRVEQTAQGTQQTVANQQGQINTIKTDTAGIHETITGQSNQIANINVTLSGLTSKYEGVSGDLGKLKSSTIQDRGTVTAPDFNSLTQAGYYTVTLTGHGKNYPTANWGVLEVSGQMNGDGRLTQKFTGDNDSGSYTRLYNATAKSWAAWIKTANQNDVTALSNRITTNSTQITQNKQAIALKADQSTVNNLSGQVSQAQAQLKVQAGQISSKVSSTDFTALNSKAMQNRGTVSSPDFNSLMQAGYYTVTLTGHGKNYPTPHWGTLEVSGQTGENGRLSQRFTGDNDSGVYTRLYNATTKSWTAWSKSANQNDITALNGKIVKNATAIDQTDQKISLKADQTEVDKVKNTAAQNSSRLNVMANEISSKVTSTDVNNIVDKKGYATTSTVQSLITQKAGTISESITNLSSKLNGLQVGGVNLVPNTDKDIVVESKTTDTYPQWDKKWIYGPLTNGQTYTISAEATNTNGVQQASVRIFLEYDGSKSVNKEAHEWFFDADGKRHSETFTVPDDGVAYAVWLYAGPMGHKQGKDFKTTYHHVKLEKGNVATDWSPAPSDNATVTQIQSITASIDGIQSTVANKADKSQITQLSNLMQSKVGTADFEQLKRAVDLQTLDSADINNMKTNGHYFVHNLANNPVGGWVYVDVTGNGADRIRQDVYQGNGNQHKYRRWFGDSWTAWSQGATESEITQLRDDINLRVKSGDLLSQINLTAHNTLIQSNKIYLDSSSTVFSGKAFIPSAAIVNLDASKLTFYGSGGTYATMGSGVKQYDDDKQKSTINLQYDGGIEIHASSQQGSILTMHDNTIRLASKSWGDNPNSYQYSGFYAAPNYSLMNTYHKDGTTSGVAIDNDRIWIYGGSKNQQLGALQADVGWYSINGDTGLLTGNQITLKSGNTQATLTDNNINIDNTSDTNDKNYDVGIHIKGWAEMTGWFTCMGLTQTSLLSTKTRIEPLDTKVALDKIVSADVGTYQFKTDVAKGKTKRHASVIIDDVHDVAEYYTPDEFISEDRKGRDDGDIVGYLMGAVQELKKQLDEVKEKI